VTTTETTTTNINYYSWTLIRVRTQTIGNSLITHAMLQDFKIIYIYMNLYVDSKNIIKLKMTILLDSLGDYMVLT
jgi:hypothetical protein